MKAHVFGGRRWKIKLRPRSRRRAHYGICHAPTSRRKHILLESGHDRLTLLTYAFHEALHACFFDLDEAAVATAARDIARFYIRLEAAGHFGRGGKKIFCP